MSEATTPPTVTIRINTSLAEVPPTALGMNVSVYDGNMMDPAVTGLLRAAGVRVLRYPGGSIADVYHWRTNSITPGQSGSADPGNDFDHFMHLVRASGAETMVTVNYGSNATGTGGGDPAEAAAWVRYSNLEHHYGVKYWEIGNEVYGNGTYGTTWETDLHQAKGPEAYGRNAVRFITAMKAVDPGIKIGVVLTAPGNWPDQDLGIAPPWNSTVLAATCHALDFVDVHWYPQDPGKESDHALLDSPHTGIPRRTPSVPTMVSRLRHEIAASCPARAGRIPIMVTETNSVSFNPGKQSVSTVNALFLADNYLTWLEQGVINVDWWQLHNGPVTGSNDSANLYGRADYGDYGVLANGQGAEPPANTPFPTYHALQILASFIQPGVLLATQSSGSNVSVHASRQHDGRIMVLLINRSTASHQIALSISGLRWPRMVSVSTYGPGMSAIRSTSRRLTGGLLTLQPYSLTLLRL